MEDTVEENEMEVRKNPCFEGTGGDNGPEKPSSAETYPPRRVWLRTLLPLMGFCVCFYIGVIGWSTLFPQYIMSRLRAKEGNASAISSDFCNISESDPSYHKEKKLQRRAASISSVASFCGGVPAMLMVLVYSSISDQLGRKVTIAIPYVGGSIVGFTIAMIVAFDGPFWLYFIASFVNGFTGASSAILAGVYASVADVTHPERRSAAIAIVQASLGLGMILSNLLIGLWAQKVGFVQPFIFLGVLMVCSGGFFFVIRETRPRNQILAARSLGLIGAVKKQLNHMKGTVFLDRHRMKQIFVVVTAIALSMLAYMGTTATLTLYVLGQPFCWDPSDVGSYNASNIAVSMVGTTLAIIFLKRYLSDLTLAMIGGFSLLGFYILTALASFITTSFHNVLIYTAIPVGAVSSLPAVALKGLGSSLLSRDEQGAFFGVVAIGEAFSFSFGPVIMSSVYTATVTTMNFFVYFFCAGLLAIMLLLLTIYKVFLAEEKSTYDVMNEGFKSSGSIRSDGAAVKDES